MNIKRILVFTLAMLIMAMPLGMAEANYAALTLSNFYLDIGMDEPLEIPASIKLGLGGELPEGPGRLDVEVTGGGQPVIAGSVGFDKEVIRAVVNGTDFYLEVPLDDLKALAEESGEFSEAPSPADFDKLTDLFDRYMAIVEKYSDEEVAKKFGLDILSAIDVEEKGKEMTDIFGEEMELYRYDLSYSAEEISGLYKAMFDADPDIKALFDDYIKLIADLGGEEVPFDSDSFGDIFLEMLEEEGIELHFDQTVWSDAESMDSTEATIIKQTILYTITETSGDEPIEIVMPVNVTVLESDAGDFVAFDMAMEPEEGEAFAMAFDGAFGMPGEDGGEVSEGGMTMSFTSESSDMAFVITLAGSHAVDKDGVADTSVVLSGEGTDMDAFSLGFNYDGTSATESEKAGVFSIDFDGQIEGAQVKGSFRCDVLLETGALSPLDEAAISGLTKINPMTADEDTLAELEMAMQGVMMQAMGVLMQTPGLSNIMGGMMSAD